MIDEARGRIDYDECGDGPTIVLVPGSCSTGAAWRPVIAAWNGQFRCVTTSLLGYGGTAERRTARDPSIAHEADIVEAVIRKAGGRVHLVGHSFGGLVALAVALRKQVPLASLAIVEAPAAELLRDCGEDRALPRLPPDDGGLLRAPSRPARTEAIAAMIDFYGGAGTYRLLAAARARLRRGDDAGQHPATGRAPMAFPLSAASLAAIDDPDSRRVGAAPATPPCNAPMRCSAQCVTGAALATIDGAAHFMIATHCQRGGASDRRSRAPRRSPSQNPSPTRTYRSFGIAGWMAVGSSTLRPSVRCRGAADTRPIAASTRNGHDGQACVPHRFTLSYPCMDLILGKMQWPEETIRASRLILFLSRRSREQQCFEYLFAAPDLAPTSAKMRKQWAGGL